MESSRPWGSCRGGTWRSNARVEALRVRQGWHVEGDCSWRGPEGVSGVALGDRLLEQKSWGCGRGGTWWSTARVEALRVRQGWHVEGDCSWRGSEGAAGVALGGRHVHSARDAARAHARSLLRRPRGTSRGCKPNCVYARALPSKNGTRGAPEVQAKSRVRTCVPSQNDAHTSLGLRAKSRVRTCARRQDGHRGTPRGCRGNRAYARGGAARIALGASISALRPAPLTHTSAAATFCRITHSAEPPRGSSEPVLSQQNSPGGVLSQRKSPGLGSCRAARPKCAKLRPRTVAEHSTFVIFAVFWGYQALICSFFGVPNDEVSETQGRYGRAVLLNSPRKYHTARLFQQAPV